MTAGFGFESFIFVPEKSKKKLGRVRDTIYYIITVSVLYFVGVRW